MATVPRHVRSIEADIARRAEALLTEGALPARVQVEGRDVFLAGRVVDAAARDRAVSLIGDLQGVRRVVDNLETPPTGAGTALAAARSDGRDVGKAGPAKLAARPPAVRVRVEIDADRGLSLSGQAPSAAAVDRWLAQAMTFTSAAAVRNRLEVFDGLAAAEASRLEEAVAQAIVLLQELDEGRIAATPSRLRISGNTEDPQLEDKIAQRLAALSPAIAVSVDVQAPRDGGATSARAVHLTVGRGRDGAVVISGNAPNIAIKQAWLERAAADYPALRVEERLRVGDFDSPEAYGECMLAALPWVERLVNGRFDIGPARVRVFGRARSGGDAARMQAELVAAGCSVDVERLLVVNEES